MRSSTIAEPGPGGVGRLPLALALGDPAGIGPEIAARAWEARHAQALPPFFVVGDVRSIAAVWDGPVERISDPAAAIGLFYRALPLIQVEDAGVIAPGEPNLAGARCALDSLELAVGLARSGAAAALVTGPVAKAQLYDIGFVHPGQTEFVAERCGVSRSNVAMMMAGPSLRTVPITMHVPLKAVSDLLTIELLVARARTVERGLVRDFAIAEPRLAVAGLNPHAGENGSIGREELDVMVPAIEQLREEGIRIEGPLAADTMFHARARARYDAALCPAHDQALIPIKTLHFDEGVNVTLGLPIVRTSPDHGTAFGIAGQDLAEPGATVAAIRLAGEMAARLA